MAMTRTPDSFWPQWHELTKRQRDDLLQHLETRAYRHANNVRRWNDWVIGGECESPKDLAKAKRALRRALQGMEGAFAALYALGYQEANQDAVARVAELRSRALSTLAMKR